MQTIPTYRRYNELMAPLLSAGLDQGYFDLDGERRVTRLKPDKRNGDELNSVQFFEDHPETRAKAVRLTAKCVCSDAGRMLE
jgi:hypothetical protein